MRRFLVLFFFTLGVIFFLLILAVGYLFIFDPFNIKPLLSGEITPSEHTVDIPFLEKTSDLLEDKHPKLNASQEKTLELFGVDPATVPTSLTSEQEACFIEILGRERVEEIKAGDVPNPVEFLKARVCVE